MQLSYSDHLIFPGMRRLYFRSKWKVSLGFYALQVTHLYNVIQALADTARRETDRRWLAKLLNFYYNLSDVVFVHWDFIAFIQ